MKLDKRIISWLFFLFVLTNNCINCVSVNHQKSLRATSDNSPQYLKNPTFLTSGYNILYGNPKMAPKSGQLLDPGFAAEIFKVTYDQKQVSGDMTYNYPDGYSLKVTQICQANFSSQTVRSKSELQKTLQASLGVEGSYGAYSGSLNAEYRDMSQSMSEEDKMFIINEAECSIYKTHVNQYSPPPLADEFLSGLKAINGKTWESDNLAYRKFFDSFGTHYIKENLMGSRYTYTLETTNSKYNSMIEKGFSVAKEAKYSAIASVSVNSSVKGDKKASEEFEKNMTNNYVTSIGAPMPGNLEMKDWFEKTTETPMPISYMLSPITQLIQIPEIKGRLTTAGLNPDGLVSGIEGAFKAIAQEIIKTNPSNQGSSISSVIKTYNTNFDADGDGNVFFLDRHKIVCPDHEALTSWRLVRGDRTIKYEYNCIRSSAISKTCTEYNTDPNDADTAKYMDRHNPKCPNGVMKGFQFLRDGNKMFFKYSCCNISVALNCNEMETERTPIGDEKTFYFDRIKIIIPAERAISEFKLKHDGKNYFYSLKHCDVKEQNIYNVNPLSGPTNTPQEISRSQVSVRRANSAQNDSGNGNIFFLDRQEVACGPNEGISQFKLSRNGNNIYYDYQCSKSDKVTTQCESKSTPINDVDSNHGSSAHFLDRHNMNCGDNSVIQKFRLARDGNRIFYNYTCCKTLNTENCNTKTTANSSNGNKSTFYLDRQNVQAENDTAFSRIKLNTVGNDFNYTTTQCFIN